MPQMAEKTEPDAPPNWAVLPQFFRTVSVAFSPLIFHSLA